MLVRPGLHLLSALLPVAVSILSGQYMHNHNVRGNEFPTRGGATATNGTEEKALPTSSVGHYTTSRSGSERLLGDETLRLAGLLDE